mmetsp:Transcript_1424/g.6216  ORF Transcript_1424/g.6216 Transcript_1424/m.6216 type:complete len:112 (-) Transcript_1424:478-813(-)
MRLSCVALVLSYGVAVGALEDLSAMRFEDSSGRSLGFRDLLDGGSLLLFVNVASFCGFTDIAYQEMQALHEKYYDAGLRLLAVPSGTFKQEPEEAWKVCAVTSGLSSFRAC